MDRPDNSIPHNAGASRASVEDDLDARIAEAVNEYEALLRSGATPDLKLFLARYQDLEPGLSACIEAIDFVGSAFAKRSLRRSPSPLGHMTRLGDFQILRKVGGGGMGEVYEAYQLSLARRVALKVMSRAQVNNANSLQRFQHEAQAAATLQHPHIVPVYSVGQVDTNYFYAMQFIDGASLAELLVRFRSREHLLTELSPVSAPELSQQSTAGSIAESVGTVVDEQSSQETHGDGYESREAVEHHPLLRLTPKTTEYFRAVAQVIKQAAEALQHAHDSGIIHRDIKPSNLMIDLKSHAWVADFGLARLPDSNLTATSDVLGTVRYMSPEQASGRAVTLDGRTDVYSLGATLYELLTLKPVFEADDRRSLLRKVIETEPVTPRQHCPQIPRELETIARKALAKEVEQRYASAADFATDLDRFLTDRPIQAQPPTAKEIFFKWLRRNRPLVVGLAILIVLILLVAIVATSIALSRISKANRLTIDANEKLAGALEEKDGALYRANMILARRDWDNGSHALARARLDATSQRHRMWEWHYLNSICQSPTREFVRGTNTFLPFTISQHGQCLFADSLWQNEPKLTIESLPGWTGGGFKSWKTKSNEIGSEFSNGRRYRFSEKANCAAAVHAEKLVSVMKVETGELLHLLTAPYPINGAVAVDDAGSVCAPLKVEDHTEIWDLNGSVKLTDIADSTRVKCWSMDFERILQESGAIRQANTGKEISKVHESLQTSIESSLWNFSPDGTCLVALNRGIKVIDAGTGSERSQFTGGLTGFAAAFSPDGMRLATAANDGALRIYDTLSGRLLLQSQIGKTTSLVLAFQEDATTLVSANNLQVKLWNCLDLIEGQHCAVVHPVAISGETDILHVVSKGSTSQIQRVDLRNGSMIETFPLQTGNAFAVEVCAQTLIAALRQQQRLQLWSLREQRLLADLLISKSDKMHFSQDGKWLIINSGHADATVTLIDVVQGAVARTLSHPGEYALSFAFSNNSQQLFVGYATGDVVAWDTVKGLKIWTASRHSQPVTAIEVDPNNRFVVSSGKDDLINIQEPQNGNVIATLRGHESTALAFHPSQPRLASAGDDSIIRIWDTDTWEPIFQVPCPGTTSKLQFSPSGDRLISMQGGAVISFGSSSPSDRKEQMQAWLYRSLTQAEQQENWFAAAWHVNKLLESDAQNPQLLARLQKIQSQESDTPSKKVITGRIGPVTAPIAELSLKTMEPTYVVITSQAQKPDMDFVKRAIDHVVGQIDESTKPWTASLAYRLYLLCPIEPSEYPELLSNFEKHTQGYNSQLIKDFVRGGLQYRTGKFDLALESLTLAESVESDVKSHVLNWLLLSMTHAQLGNLKQAEDWLKKAKQWRKNLSLSGFSKVDFQFRLPFSVLLREAEQLLFEKSQTNHKQ